MNTIGFNCDITITHPSVNGGQPVGFICKRSRSEHGVVTLRRQAYVLPEGGYQDALTFGVTVLAGSDLRCPNGARFDRSRSQIYASLLAFLAARDGLALGTPIGAFSNLHATLNVTSEYIGHDTDEIVLALNNGAAAQTAPIDLTR